MTDSQYSQSALNGMAMRRRDTIPVPIVTLNHEGEKLRTILRQPTYSVVSSWSIRAERPGLRPDCFFSQHLHRTLTFLQLHWKASVFRIDSEMVVFCHETLFD